MKGTQAQGNRGSEGEGIEGVRAHPRVFPLKGVQAISDLWLRSLAASCFLLSASVP